MTKEEKLSRVRELAHNYKLQGYHCSESMIRAVPEVLDIKVSEEIIKTACGFFGGGGGTRGRCGIVEVCLMLISILYGRLDAEASDQDIRDLAAELVRRFNAEFGSLNCCDIKPKEVEKYGEDFGCMRIYEEGSVLITKLLLEADEILTTKR